MLLLFLIGDQFDVLTNQGGDFIAFIRLESRHFLHHQISAFQIQKWNGRILSVANLKRGRIHNIISSFCRVAWQLIVKLDAINRILS